LKSEAAFVFKLGILSELKVPLFVTGKNCLIIYQVILTPGSRYCVILAERSAKKCGRFVQTPGRSAVLTEWSVVLPGRFGRIGERFVKTCQGSAWPCDGSANLVKPRAALPRRQAIRTGICVGRPGVLVDLRWSVRN
jgi:hypothetical protein